MKIGLYSLLDILVGIFISKIKLINNKKYSKENKNKTKEKLNSEKNDKSYNNNYYYDYDRSGFFYLEIIYLFNPLSIMCCVSLQLRTIYNFLLFFSIEKLTKINFNENENDYDGFTVNFLKLFFINVICIFCLLITPGNFFILMFFYIKNFEGLKNKKIFFVVFTALISLLIFWVVFFTNNFSKEPIESFYLYQNYFLMKDTFPNYGILWNLIPEVNKKI